MCKEDDDDDDDVVEDDVSLDIKLPLACGAGTTLIHMTAPAPGFSYSCSYLTTCSLVCSAKKTMLRLWKVELDRRLFLRASHFE